MLPPSAAMPDRAAAGIDHRSFRSAQVLQIGLRTGADDGVPLDRKRGHEWLALVHGGDAAIHDEQVRRRRARFHASRTACSKPRSYKTTQFVACAIGTGLRTVVRTAHVISLAMQFSNIGQCGRSLIIYSCRPPPLKKFSEA